MRIPPVFGRRRSIAVAIAVLTCATAIVGTPASTVAASTAPDAGHAGTEPDASHGGDLSGDSRWVINTPTGSTTIDPEDDAAIASFEASAAGAGYALQSSPDSDPLGPLSGYTVRIVKDHPQWNQLTETVRQASIQLSAATGAKYAMGSPTSSHAAAGNHTISISLSSGNVCGGAAIGCARTVINWTGRDPYWEIAYSEIWVTPTLLAYPGDLMNTVLHELGHAAGLLHFDGTYQGTHQVMRSYLGDAPLWYYQWGDENGLAATAANGFARGYVIPYACLLSITDVRITSPFCDDIGWMIASGIASGFDDGSFRPTTTLTRQAAASFLYKLAGSPGVPSGAPTFSDVPAGHPFRNAIRWMAWQGITTGYADGTFRPTGTLTRQAIASFLHKMAGKPPVPPGAPTFRDVPAGHPFAASIRWMAAERITSGYADGTFRPSAGLARQAMASFLHKYAT